MKADEERDEALPATLRFTITYGILLLVGWFSMWFLLQSRLH